jgi:hypothetical protein
MALLDLNCTKNVHYDALKINHKKAQRKELERLCRYITRPAIANERLKRNGAGDVVLQPKSAYREGTTHRDIAGGIHATPAALVPRPRLHLIP